MLLIALCVGSVDTVLSFCSHMYLGLSSGWAAGYAIGYYGYAEWIRVVIVESLPR